MKINHLIYRLILLTLLLMSLTLSGLSLFFIYKYQPSDLVFLTVVFVIISIFILFELVLTIINIKKPLSLAKIAITMRNQINYIPLIAVGIGLFLSLVFLIIGIVFYFVKNVVDVRSSSLVLVTIGFYLFINCAFYIGFILSYRKKVDTKSNFKK